MTTTDTAIRVFVAGHPAPQGSKRGIVHRHTGKVAMVESSSKVKPWREDIRAALLVDGQQPLGQLAGPVHVKLDFVMRRPASTPKRTTPPAVKKPDLDKLVRAVLDAITSAGIWHDDSQATRITATKRLAELTGRAPGETEPTGCHITIEPADGYPTITVEQLNLP